MPLDRQAPGCDAGDIEQVPDQPVHLLRRAADDAELLAEHRLLLDFWNDLQQEARAEGNRVHRVPQVVRYYSQDFFTEPHGLVQRLLHSNALGNVHPQFDFGAHRGSQIGQAGDLIFRPVARHDVHHAQGTECMPI